MKLLEREKREGGPTRRSIGLTPFWGGGGGGGANQYGAGLF